MRAATLSAPVAGDDLGSRQLHVRRLWRRERLREFSLQAIERLLFASDLVAAYQVADIFADVFIVAVFGNVGSDEVAERAAQPDSHGRGAGHARLPCVFKISNIEDKTR